MREIKFRVWDKEKKKMIYYDKDCSSPDMTLNGVLISHDKQSNVSYRYELMQFTGLKDKNGKEIWEGDICKETHEHILADGKPCEDGWTSHSMPIEFHNGMFAFGYQTSSLSYFIKCWGLVVIGNIHENPELKTQ